MQAIIMAAGQGKRISNFTGDMPKGLLKIKGKAIIDYQIDYLEEFGINEIIVVTGYKKEVFESKFARKPNIKLAYNPFYGQTNVIASFWFGMPYLKEDFIYFHADTFIEREIFERLYHEEGDIVLPVDLKKCVAEEMRVVLNERQEVLTISKEIPAEEADGEFIGVAKISEKILPALKKFTNYFIERQDFQLFFESVIQKCIDEKICKPVIIDVSNNIWGEIDFIEDYEKIKKMVE